MNDLGLQKIYIWDHKVMLFDVMSASTNLGHFVDFELLLASFRSYFVNLSIIYDIISL